MSQANLKALAKGEVPESANRYEVFRGRLQGSDDLKKYLGNSKAYERFIATCISAVVERPQLLDADMRTLLSACKKAAQDGLEPNGREAVLNVYRTNIGNKQTPKWVEAVQYLPMVLGIIKLMYEAGATYVDAACVYEKDKFEFVRGDESKIEHRPYLGVDPGQIIAVYCVVKLATGEIKREVMPRWDIDRTRAASKTPDRGPWADWFDQMAIKSVLKRVRKQMPMTDARLDSAIANDNEAAGYQFGSSAVADVMQQAHQAPALEHSEPVTLAQDMPEGEDEKVPAQTKQPAAKPAKSKTITTFASIVASFEGATTVKDLAALANLIEEAAPEEQDELRDVYEQRRQALEGTQ